MEKRMLIAISVAIGVVAGGFTGYGVFFALKPAPPAPTTYTLTIVSYKEDAFNYYLNWTPSNAGNTYINDMAKHCASIVFEENTKVSLIACSYGTYNAWTLGPDASDVVWVTGQVAYILMNSNKTIEVSWD